MVKAERPKKNGFLGSQAFKERVLLHLHVTEFFVALSQALKKTHHFQSAGFFAFFPCPPFFGGKCILGEKVHVVNEKGGREGAGSQEDGCRYNQPDIHLVYGIYWVYIPL